MVRVRHGRSPRVRQPLRRLACHRVQALRRVRLVLVRRRDLRESMGDVSELLARLRAPC
jgi:hypothetical protein